MAIASTECSLIPLATARGSAWGCVALENEDVRELFNAVPNRTPVTIQP
jgi:hypothetical protein